MNLRPYAERMVRARPGLFRLDCPSSFGPWEWELTDLIEGTTIVYPDSVMKWERRAWAFIGPLLDELKIDPIMALGAWAGKSQTMTWLEAAFEAVCSHLEANPPTPPTPE